MPIGVTPAPYAKFPQAGTKHGGEIVGFRVVQNIDPKTKAPLYLQEAAPGKWEKVNNAFGPDGRPNDPICQWEITVDTGVEDDNGDSELRIFVDPRRGRRGTTTFGKRGGDAVATALKKAKAHRVGLEIGGKFWLIFDGKVDDGDNKVNTWSAEYEPPAGGPGSGAPLDEVPWVVGGSRYDKAAELAKWEASKSGGAQAGVAFVPPVAPAPAARTEDFDDPWATSSAARQTATQGIRDTTVTSSSYDDEPPF